MYPFLNTIWGLPRSRYSGPARPGLDDLLDPFEEPVYPEEPTPIRRIRDLQGPERRQFTMQTLANIASALGGSRQGYLGSGLAEAAQASLGAERETIDLANERQGQEYRRSYQLAQQRASEAEQKAEREQKRTSIENMLALGDQAIEAAGGADADPTFAARVYSFMRERNTSALQGALKEAGERRRMREKYNLDPGDPLAMEAYNSRRELDAKVEEENRLGPIRTKRELEEYEEKQKIERRYPAPREPQRDRVDIDPQTGQVINMDAVLRQGGGQAMVPIPGFTPRPRVEPYFRPDEQEAWETALREEAEYRKSARRPFYQNKNPNMPGFLRDEKTKQPVPDTDPRLGKDVPFDVETAYQSRLRQVRKLKQEGEAKADPSGGVRGPAPNPTGQGVQAPKGAPVGLGGSPGKGQPDPRRAAEVERKVASVQAIVKTPLTEEQKKFLRQNAGTMSVPQMVARINQMRQGQR